jgi:hypothetical protein
MGEVLQLGDELHVRPGTTLAPTPCLEWPLPPQPPSQPPQPQPVVHSAASITAALAAVAAMGAGGLATPPHYAPAAGDGAPAALSCSAGGAPHQ